MSDRIEVPWGTVLSKISVARSYWVVTAGPGGPHAAPVWGVAAGGGRVAFATSPSAVKAVNLRADPRCTVHLDSADDVVILRGAAHPLGPGDVLAAARRDYPAKYVMPDSGEPCPLGEEGVWLFTPATALTWLEPAFGRTMTRWTVAADGSAEATAISYG